MSHCDDLMLYKGFMQCVTRGAHAAGRLEDAATAFVVSTKCALAKSNDQPFLLVSLVSVAAVPETTSCG